VRRCAAAASECLREDRALDERRERLLAIPGATLCDERGRLINNLFFLFALLRARFAFFLAFFLACSAAIAALGEGGGKSIAAVSDGEGIPPRRRFLRLRRLLRLLRRRRVLRLRRWWYTLSPRLVV